MIRKNLSPYLCGEKLYGDDFSAEQIEQWFRDEAEGYYNLVRERRPGRYEYHALNRFCGFDRLPINRMFEQTLGVGSAFGDEFEPILHRCKNVTILESAEGFFSPRFRYVKPQINGIFPFDDASFDLITCFGVLHHIPNVTIAMQEMSRCLASGGFLLLREPIVSMGDWSRPRPGLTKHERGIPLSLFRRMISKAGLRVLYEAKVGFPITPRLRYLMRGPVYNSRVVVRLDAALCRLPFWSTAYHPMSWLDRFRANMICYVLYRDVHSTQ